MKYMYFSLIGFYGFFEFYIQHKIKSENRTTVTDITYFLIFIPFFLLFLSPIYCFYVYQYEPNIINFSLFIPLFLAGMAIRFKGYIDLGTNFSDKIELKSHQTLINYGIYRYIRHPLYLASILMTISVICYKCSYLTYIPALLTIIGIALRIYKEENYLLLNFEGYQEYCKNTKRLIPGIF